MPGIYVVTSTAFVSRPRSTFRSADFYSSAAGVNTRMHTPRFSGQPASAGDLVFMRTASRPILTNCENVGTVVPLSRVIFHPESIRNGCAGDARLPQGAQTKWRESAAPVLKGLLRIRRYHQQEPPYALQQVEPIPCMQFGEAYSALRCWRPSP